MEFTSAYKIGQRVSVHVSGVKIEGHVRTVIFTSSKVRYSVRVLGDETTLHNIDSAFVTSEPNAEILDMPEDNYS
jgi:predicted transcriptional regulator